MLRKILNVFHLSKKEEISMQSRNKSDDELEDSLWEIKDVYDFDTEEIQVSIDAYRKRKSGK
tara:strand:- start:298 stop:483 length:186 start_codon:yes stop_codon:yes gene_type:complete